VRDGTPEDLDDATRTGTLRHREECRELPSEGATPPVTRRRLGGGPESADRQESRRSPRRRYTTRLSRHRRSAAPPVERRGNDAARDVDSVSSARRRRRCRAERPTFGADVIARRIRLPFAAGSSTRSGRHGPANRPRFNRRRCGSYAKRSRRSNGYGYDAGAHIVCGFVNPEGAAQTAASRDTSTVAASSRSTGGDLRHRPAPRAATY